MKTLLKLLGITVLVAVIGFIISCGGGGGGGGITTPPGEKPDVPLGGEPECAHNWSGWSTYISPDGAEVGKPVAMTEKRTCSICGEIQTRNSTTFTPTVIIDLTTGGILPASIVNTALPDIDVTLNGSDIVLIIGDSTRNETGRDVTIENAVEEIYIADKTIINARTASALSLPPISTKITGGGDVSITGGNQPIINASGGGIRILGTISELSTNNAPVIACNTLEILGAINIIKTKSNGFSVPASVTISGTIGEFTAVYPLISSSDITITSTAAIGNMTCTYVCLTSTGSIKIEGTIGAITCGQNVPCISAKNLIISGKTGPLKGGDVDSGEGLECISINPGGDVTITGTVGSNTADDIKGGSGDTTGPQIRIYGDKDYNDWPDFKSWPH